MIIAITGIGEKSEAYTGYHVDKAYSFAELCNKANYDRLLATVNENTVIIGHSAGSLVALTIAAVQPLRQLILIGPGLELGDVSELRAKDPQSQVKIDKTNPSFAHYVAEHPLAELQIAEQFRSSAAATLVSILTKRQAVFIFSEFELAKQVYTEQLLDASNYRYEVIAGCNHYDILNNPETQKKVNHLISEYKK